MSLPAVAETRVPCFAVFAACLFSLLQIINHSVVSVDSSLVNCILLRVAFRSSLLNDSNEFIVRWLGCGLVCGGVHLFQRSVPW